MKDMAKKKRRSWEGVANPNCRLSDDEIEEIRRRYILRNNSQQLAEEFGCSVSTIRNIVTARFGRYRAA
jgi:DNA-directed RNA polymerase specialized sigma24 family protein